MKTVLVTGAADGIGWASAALFAGQGWRVALADLDGAKVAERAGALGPDHIGLAMDVSSEADAVAGVRAALSAFGSLDALVNNAGIGDTHLPTLDQTLDAFGRVLDVHLKGTFLLSREAGRAMLAAGSGAIVNLASIAGLTGLPRRNAYGAAKAGIAAMTRAMACEWAAGGIRVNAVAPGYVETALVRKLADAGRIDAARLRRRIPMGRLADPAEIAEAIVFLASDRARYITGIVLGVDGGWAAFGDAGDAFAADEAGAGR